MTSDNNGTHPATPVVNLTDAFSVMVKQAVAEAIRANQRRYLVLLKPEELAARLKVPKSWVYEQSRLGNIPAHKVGKYIRFDLQEVIEGQKNQNKK